jgi:hypothetical protein
MPKRVVLPGTISDGAPSRAAAQLIQHDHIEELDTDDSWLYTPRIHRTIGEVLLDCSEATSSLTISDTYWRWHR